MKSLSRARLLATPWTAAYQALPPMGSPGKSAGVGCHRFLPKVDELKVKEDYLARRFRMKRVTENNHSGLCLFHLTLVNAVMFY